MKKLLSGDPVPQHVTVCKLAAVALWPHQRGEDMTVGGVIVIAWTIQIGWHQLTHQSHAADAGFAQLNAGHSIA